MFAGCCSIGFRSWDLSRVEAVYLPGLFSRNYILQIIHIFCKIKICEFLLLLWGTDSASTMKVTKTFYFGGCWSNTAEWKDALPLLWQRQGVSNKYVLCFSDKSAVKQCADGFVQRSLFFFLNPPGIFHFIFTSSLCNYFCTSFWTCSSNMSKLS